MEGRGLPPPLRGPFTQGDPQVSDHEDDYETRSRSAGRYREVIILIVRT